MPILKMSSSKKNVSEAIAYVLDKAKSTLRAVLNMNPNEDYAKQMERNARLWGKDKPNTRTFYHLKLAFHPHDSDRNGGPLTDWIAIQVATRLIQEFAAGYQALLSVHNDTAHKHVHIIISAVHPLTGKAVNISPGAYRRMKDRANEIAAAYGLSTIDWRAAVIKKRNGEIQPELPVNECFAEQGMKNQGKRPWKSELRYIIDAVQVESNSLGEFRGKLAEKGVTLTRCSSRGITYQFKDHPPVRGDTLGGDYTYAAILNTIRHNADWPDNCDMDVSDRELYKSWGRAASVNRSEVEAITEEIHRATWTQKQDVWNVYRDSKEAFWSEWRRRRAVLKEELDEAYRHRKLVKDAQWVLNPKNRKKCLAGIIFAAIILHRYGNREQIEEEIRNLRGKMELLRKESVEFRNQSEAAILNLRQRELTLDQYLEHVLRMQELAEGMFRQPTQEMAILWAVERNARVKDPTLEEYIEMCIKEQKDIEREEKEHEKESCV